MKFDLEDSIKISEDDFPVNGYKWMAQMRHQGKLCDITLCVGNSRRFSAHRVVLAASIPYFRAMFTLDMVEAGMSEIILNDIDADAVNIFVNFAYTGCVVIDMENVQNVLIGACFFQLSSIREKCCKFLSERLTVSNCIPLLSVSETFMCSSLAEQCSRYIRKNFVHVSQTEEFLSLSENEIISILIQDGLNVEKEEQVFERALSWLNYNIEERKSSLYNLLSKTIRFPLMQPSYLSDVVSADPLIRSSLECRDLVDEAKDYYLLPERRSVINSARTRPRCCTDMAGFIYSIGGLTCSGESVAFVETLSPFTNQWSTCPSMLMPRSRLGVAVHKGLLYAIGGYDGTQRLCSVECFDPSTNVWSHVAPLNTRRSVLGAVSLPSSILVCGGYNGIASLHSTETYNPSTNTWSPGVSMLKARSAAGVCRLRNQVFAAGGHDGLSIFKSVECFDIENNTWTLVSPMLTKRCRLGVATLHDKIFACGGYDGSKFLNSAEMYDPFLNQWMPIASMQTRRSRVALISTGGILYALGGYDGSSNLNTVEVYHPDEDAWTFASPMIVHEGGVGAAVVIDGKRVASIAKEVP